MQELCLADTKLGRLDCGLNAQTFHKQWVIITGQKLVRGIHVLHYYLLIQQFSGLIVDNLNNCCIQVMESIMLNFVIKCFKIFQLQLCLKLLYFTETKHGSKNGKKEGVSGSSFFTWFMVIALLGVWTSVAVVWFELVDYEEVLGKNFMYCKL